MTTFGTESVILFTLNQPNIGRKNLKTRIVGFILVLLLCAMVSSGVTEPSPYTISHSGPSSIAPGESGTFTFTVKKDGIPQSGVTVFIYRRPETNSYLSNETPVTDANGSVQTTLTLESGASGTYRITASAPDREGGKLIDEDIDYVRFDVTVSDSQPPPEPEPSKLVRISDDDQTAAPGDSVPLIVELQDSNDNPISGVRLNFILFGNQDTGTRSPEIGTTDADGRAQTTLTLSSDAEGEYIVEVHRIDDFSVYVHYTVTVDASPPPLMPTTLKAISDDNQNGLTGEELENPFVVEVRDQYYDPMEGATVTFTISAGGGSLSVTTSMTNANGQAESTLTLGTDAGTNTVAASVEGISQTQVFSAEASLPPPIPSTLSIVSGENQNGLTGEELENPFVVEVRDQYYDPMEGVTVTFTISAGGGSLSVTTSMTNANGQAESTLTLGTDAGTNTVTASVEGITRTEMFSAEAAAKDPTISVSTSSPLTEKVLDGSQVTVTLEDGTFEQSLSTIKNAVTISGIAGVSVGTIERVSDTEVVIVLAYDGTDFDADATLNVSVDAGAIADYSDSSLTASPPVTAIIEPEPLAIYWIDRGTNSIRAASLDGSRNEGIVTHGLNSPRGLALDVEGGQMYWTQWGAKKIQRANLDGSIVEDLVTQGLEMPRDIAVAGSKMYWTDSGVDKIQRADLDGSNVEDLVTRELHVPNGLALDTVAGKMYWIDSGADKIQRANLDGSNVENLVTQGLEFPIDIALHVTGGKMYWTDVTAGKIQRANLDGSNVENIVTGLRAPHSIALDVANLTMYWTDWRAKTIQRANLNGSGVEDVVTSGIDSPSSIAIGSSSVQPPVATTDPVDEKDDEEMAYQAEDVNRDGTVDVQDIVYIAQHYAQTGQSNADVNGDEIVNVVDLLLVAAALDNMSAAPAARAQLPNDITAATIQQWLTEAKLTGKITPVYQRGILVLEQLLAALTPIDTALLANYPNPFNPETWIPYHLANAVDVTISIYDVNGTLIRQLDMGHQMAGYYTARSRAAYWDGRNEFGEQVATGVYFYQLQADNVSFLRKMVILK